MSGARARGVAPAAWPLFAYKPMHDRHIQVRRVWSSDSHTEFQYSTLTFSPSLCMRARSRAYWAEKRNNPI